MVDQQQIDREVQSNLDAVGNKLDALKFNSRCMDIAEDRPKRNIVGKLFALRQVVDELCTTVTPHSACRHGCSHCCNMAVAVSEPEARSIADHLHKGFVRHKGEYDADGDRLKYTGKPCPFLLPENDRHRLYPGNCLIYEVRPLACRGYFNLSDTPEICDIVNSPGQDVPSIDNTVFGVAQVLSFGTEYQDIRDWFPREKLL